MCLHLEATKFDVIELRQSLPTMLFLHGYFLCLLSMDKY